MKRAIFLVFLIIGIVVGVFPHFSLAQSYQIVNASDILMSTTPELPGPYENVTISLESYAINIDISRITWIINGEQLLDGVGEKKLTVKTGNLGEPLLVEVRVRWNQIDTIIKRVRIEPAYVDLLWEAVNSYTPPFYKGKALPSSESYLRVVALPSGVIGNDQFVYTWQHNGDVKQDKSGFKKHSFEIRNNFFDKKFHVDVDVTGRLTPFRAHATLIVPRFDPEIHFAVENILGDPINQINGGFKIGGQFNNLVAHPYYFSAAESFKYLQAEWKIDGESYFPPLSSSRPINEIPVVPPTEGSGFSNVYVQIVNNNEILQQAEGQIQVRF